ncbi:hypothetical protein K504DRAFT_490172 [Pleomassaria siparia CBS 279.74]|uniref:F-box domain-containing protein n=1 Tax=Pleomassaria siparia CBS 279.74 TaxID=1314801 RepID=A0A6G1KAI2_9PLEO|nr:hypothetical protein K504DRAFT_490172 [Pleomassaria siparia CBS 279.74]
MDTQHVDSVSRVSDSSGSKDTTPQIEQPKASKAYARTSADCMDLANNSGTKGDIYEHSKDLSWISEAGKKDCITHLTMLSHVYSREKREERNFGLKALPAEILCQILSYLNTNDVFSMRQLCKNVTWGVDPAFKDHFFAHRSLETTGHGIQRFNRFLETRFAQHVRFLTIVSNLIWLPFNYNGKLVLGKNRDDGWLELAKWAPLGAMNFLEDYDRRQIVLGHQPWRNPFYRIFSRMKDLQHVEIVAPYTTQRRTAYTTWFNALDQMRFPRDCAGNRFFQYGIFNSIFRAIKDTGLPLRSLIINGFSEHRTGQFIAPSPLILGMLGLSSFRELRELRIEHDVHMSDPSSAFLSILNHTTQLRTLSVCLAGDLNQKALMQPGHAIWTSARIEHVIKTTTTLISKLSHQADSTPNISPTSALLPFLTTLVLKGLCICGTVTIDHVFSAHAKTLRHVFLNDVFMEQPNNMLRIYEAVAKADLEFLYLRRFWGDSRQIKGGRANWEQDKPDEVIQWDEHKCTENNEDKNMCLCTMKDEAYKDYVCFSWEHFGFDTWVGWAGKQCTVKDSMLTLATMHRTGFHI